MGELFRNTTLSREDGMTDHCDIFVVGAVPVTVWGVQPLGVVPLRVVGEGWARFI